MCEKWYLAQTVSRVLGNTGMGNRRNKLWRGRGKWFSSPHTLLGRAYSEKRENYLIRIVKNYLLGLGKDKIGHLRE